MTIDQDPPISDDPSELRKAADRAAASDQRANLAERKVAFYQAGVDPTAGIGELFFEGYKGEDLTPETIQQEWKKLWSTINPAGDGDGDPTPNPTATDPEPNVGDAVEDLLGSQNSAPAMPQVADLLEQGYEEFHKRMQQGAHRDRAAAEVIDRIITGAMAEHASPTGEPRFLYDREVVQDRIGRGPSKIAAPVRG